MEFRILGPLEVVDGGGPLALQRHKSRGLLAYLVLHPNEVVSTDRLVDALWGEEAPPTAIASLHNSVSRLRKALGADVLVSQPPGYVLRVRPEQVDWIRFERLVDEARQADARERAEKLRAALALWRGPPLADLAFEPFAQADIGRLEATRLAALEDRIDADLALGRHGALVAELEALVAEHPLRERLRGQLMLALYRSGRQVDALAAYRDARRLLHEEQGLEPGEDLQRLERAILVHDAALAPPARPAAPVPEPPRPEPPAPTVTPASRKVVTVLFADVISSTALGDSLDPEALRDVMSSFFEEMRAAIERHGGTVEKFAGDSVMAVFGVPVAHEDDALRAARAAVEMRDALSALNDVLERDRGVRLDLRTGINTGEVVAGDASSRQTFVTGDAVNVAKRLEEGAAPGEIVLGPATFARVRNAVDAEPVAPLDLRGKPQPLAAHRLLRVLEGAPPFARRLDAPLVGREGELARLRGEFERARDERRCVLVTVLGDAGIGKTRLVNELASSLREEARLLVGRCTAYGEGATYLPLTEVVRRAAPDTSPEAIASVLTGEEDAELVAQRVAELIGASHGPSSAGESFWAVRRFLEALAREQPLVVVFEDVHWAEPTFLDLVEYVAGWSSGAPILVVAVARPELVEARPGWGGAASLALEPLPDAQAYELVASLAADSPVPPAAQSRIVDVAEGNALFVEQLLAHVIEEGTEELERVPPSLEALLASRLDRLEPAERAALQRAAVVGREFWRGAVLDLSRATEVAAVERSLMALVRKRFVCPGQSSLPREDGFRFHHVLVRDVAYAGIPKSVRADLHERFADWLDRRASGYEEVVGYHLEQAFHYRTELGPVDRNARRLAADAGERLGRAGIRAWGRADARAAVNLLTRAASLLPPSDALRRELLCELGPALRATEVDRAEHVLSEAIATSSDAGDRRLELRARIELAHLRIVRNPDGSGGELLELAGSAIPTFEAFGDDRSLGRTHLFVGYVRGGIQCQNAEWERAAERAIFHYRRSGWSPSTAMSELAAALLHGPTPVEEAIDRLHDLLAAGADLAGEAHVRAVIGALEAQRGRFADARLLIERARTTYEQLGQRDRVASTCALFTGTIEMLAGRPADAEVALRASCDTLERIGDHVHLSTVAGELAEAIYAQGHFEEAEEWTRTAERHASADDVSARLASRPVRAKLLARFRAVDEAVAAVTQAIELARHTDALNRTGNVLLAAAEIFRLAGDASAAGKFVEEAVDVFERKGNLVSARTAASLLTLV